MLVRALVACCLLLASSVLAAAPGQNRFLSPRVYKAIDQLYEAVEAKDFQVADDLLAELHEKRKSTFEEAVIWRAVAYLEISRDNYRGAIDAFEAAMVLDVIEPVAANDMRYSLGQLYLSLDQPDKALKWLAIWAGFANEPRAESLMTLAYAQYQTERFKDAEQTARRAIALAVKPSANWYDLAATAAEEDGRPDDAIIILQSGVMRRPQEEPLWHRLISLYLDTNREAEALAAAQLALSQGHMQEANETTLIAQLYVGSGLPFEGGALMEKNLDVLSQDQARRAEHYEFLFSALALAREHATARRYLVQAAERAATGKLHVQLGQLSMEAQQWAAAVEAFKTALQLGGLQDGDQVRRYLIQAALAADMIDVADDTLSSMTKAVAQDGQVTYWREEIARRQSGDEATARP